MKNIAKYILTFTATATTFSGCSNYEDQDINLGTGTGVRTSFLAQMANDNDTRAEITIDGSKFTGTWEGSDKLGIITTAPESTTPVLNAFTYDGATFTGELPSTATGAWSYQAFYPHTAVVGTKVSLPFGNSRTQQGNKFNSAYDALVANAVVCTNAAPGVDDAGKMVSFELHRLTSILNMEIKNGTSTDKVKALLLSSKNSTQPLSAATLEFDAAQGATASATLGAQDKSKMIAMTYDEGTAPLANQINALFNIPAGNYDELTFDVITEANQIATATIRRNDAQNPYIAGKIYQYQKSEPMLFNALAAPSLNWPGQDMNAIHEITVDGEGQLTYQAAIDIAVPGGIAALTVNITSDPLNMMGISRLDLVNESSIPGAGIEYSALGLSCGTEVQYHKATTFNITTLVPLIAVLPNSQGVHVFSITVTDLAGQSTTQNLRFSIAKPNGAYYNADADLWANTGTMTAHPAAGAKSVTLEYRIKGQPTWNTADMGTADASGVYRNVALNPRWSTTTNTAGSIIYAVDSRVGLFANHTYEYQLTVDGLIVNTGEFTTGIDSGDKLPYGDMNTWSKYIGYNPEWVGNPDYDGYEADYPNPSLAESFWGNGNNAFALGLCTPATDNTANPEDRYAQLQGNAAFGTIFAAGNLFTGIFDLPGMAGYARFGQKYTFTARPSALKVKVKASINNIEMLHPDETFPLPEAAKIGNVDPARIFVCITDWSDRHSVYSGLGVTPEELNAFNPLTDAATAEGNVIGYGEKMFTQSIGEWTEIIIPIKYRNKSAKPTPGNYSLVISCASSAYGDYLCGSPSNSLSIDNIEWVY